MIGTTATEIMDQAITLEEGDHIVVRCDNYEDMESLRVNLYKARKALMKTHRTLAYMLYISREIKEDGHYVFVTKEKTAANVVIVSKDGTVRPFERVEPSVISDETELDRVARLMKEDGKTEEEISDTLAEMGEDNFDKGATRLEQMQADGEVPESVETVKGKKNVRKKKETTSK